MVVGLVVVYLQVLCLFYVFFNEVFFQVFKGFRFGLYFGRSVEGFREEVDEVIRFLGVVVVEFGGVVVRFVVRNGVRFIQFSFDGVVVRFFFVRYRQGEVIQVIAVLAQQVEFIVYVFLDQVVFCFFSGDVVKEEGQVVGVVGRVFSYVCVFFLRARVYGVRLGKIKTGYGLGFEQ